ncbi:hypothetical protein HDU84_001954 [Entophlyctis sp. JEL0112]|nr:hypothetical protein HDU84_001954 [Entophlyctis sp. JEL0112]
MAERNTPSPSAADLAPGDKFFVDRIKLPEAAPLMSELKLWVEFEIFLASFGARSLTINDQRKAISSFLDIIVSASLENPAFANVLDEEQVEFVREGWEKARRPLSLVMMKLHDFVFGAKGTEEPKMERHLSNKLRAFSWVKEHHLDIPYDFSDNELVPVIAEIGKLNAYRSPKDKVTVFMSVVELAVDALKKQHDSAGNDLLLPVLILVLIRANPSNVISNVKFRSKNHVESGQVQYSLTTLMSAITFIYSMTLESLTLSDSELEAYRPLVPKIFHSPLPTGPAAKNAQTANQLRGGSSVPRALAGTQTAASAFISTNTSATTALSGFAAQMARALDSTASALRGAAETVGGTVDGFAQGLIAGLKDDGAGTSSAAGNGAVSSTALAPTESKVVVPVDIRERPSSNRSLSPARLSGSPGNAGAAKAGTAFANGLKASRHAALKLFSAAPATHSATESIVVSGNDNNTEVRSGVEARYHDPPAGHGQDLTEEDVEALEDYEMQLAMALSLSEAGEQPHVGNIPTGVLIDVDLAGEGDSDEEEPLESKTRKAVEQ